MNDNPVEEMPEEIDFSKGVRGKFYRRDMKPALPVYLDNDVQCRLSNLATAKGVDISDFGQRPTQEGS